MKSINSVKNNLVLSFREDQLITSHFTCSLFQKIQEVYGITILADIRGYIFLNNKNSKISGCVGRILLDNSGSLKDITWEPIMSELGEDVREALQKGLEFFIGSLVVFEEYRKHLPQSTELKTIGGYVVLSKFEYAFFAAYDYLYDLQDENYLGVITPIDPKDVYVAQEYKTATFDVCIPVDDNTGMNLEGKEVYLCQADFAYGDYAGLIFVKKQTADSDMKAMNLFTDSKTPNNQKSFMNEPEE